MSSITGASSPYAPPTMVDDTATTDKPQVDTGKMMRQAGIVCLGALLTFVGWMGAMMMVIMELFPSVDGSGPSGSLFGDAFPTAASEWGAYLFATLVFATGAILVGSQPFSTVACMAYIMCPIVYLTWALASPLRMIKKHRQLTQRIYISIGFLLLCGGFFVLSQNYPGEFTLNLFYASVAVQVGMAAFLGGLFASRRHQATLALNDAQAADSLKAVAQ